MSSEKDTNLWVGMEHSVTAIVIQQLKHTETVTETSPRQPFQILTFNRQLCCLRKGHLSSTLPNNLQRRSVAHVARSLYSHIATMLMPMKFHCETVLSNKNKEYINKLMASSEPEDEIQEFIRNETPMDRLKRVFLSDPSENGYTPQQRRIQVGFFASTVTLYLLSSILATSEALKDFKKKHLMSVYQSPSAAQLRRFRYVFAQSIKTGVRSSVKGTLILMPILIIQQAVEVYLNKTTPLSFVISFGLAGSVSRISLGLKGMFSGGVLGAGFGLAGGLCWTASAMISGETQDRVNYETVGEMFHIQRNLRAGRERDYREDVDDFD